MKIYNYFFSYGNYDEIKNIVSGVLQTYPTNRLIEKVQYFMGNHPDIIANIKESLQESLELAQSEVNIFRGQSGNIIAIVKPNNPPSTDKYRLPTDVIPSSYEIKLAPKIEPSNGVADFDGTVKIQARVTKNTHFIVLHAKLSSINEVNVYQMDGNNPPIQFDSEIQQIEDYDLLNIYVLEGLNEDTEIIIEITYTGILNDEMRGFYRSSYKFNGGTRYMTFLECSKGLCIECNKLMQFVNVLILFRWLAATHLEPVGARRVFPCFDEPALKASFNISVVASGKYNVTSNMNLKQGSPTT